jgi:two-component system nitrogen regulation response regulator NtrX
VHEVPHPSKDILVVDDDAIMRDLICDWLVAAGYAVRRAGDCHAAVAQLGAAAPALVVSDLWMPGPRGAEAIRSLRQMHPEVAVIAVSGAVAELIGPPPK